MREPTHVRKNMRLNRRLLLALGASLICINPVALAQRGIISGNQHPVVFGDPCDQQPFQALARSQDVGASSYHIDKVHNTFVQARCYVNNTSSDQKPKIYSDDASFTGATRNEKQKGYIGEICSAIQNHSKPRGFENYEHYEAILADKAKLGLTIGGWNTWQTDGTPWPGARDMMAYIHDSGCAGLAMNAPMSPNGTLTRGISPDISFPHTEVFFWNGEPATLIGFSHMGALAAGNRAILLRTGANDGFLDTLRTYRANLTRIWAIEQWTGRAVCPSPHAEGLTPFSGSYPDYDLSISGLNPLFFARLREFAQLAADRGIVVQLSLFDKHGLIDNDINCPGQWPSSPYNRDANLPTIDFLDGGDLNGACCQANDCGSIELFDSENDGNQCNTLDAFLNDSRIVPIQNAYLELVAKEVGGVGNMIFEIMNEMKSGVDWNTNGSGAGAKWQKDYVACRMFQELPTFVARDAFNGELGNIGLNGKLPDAGGGTGWTGNNAETWGNQDAQTGIWMGSAVPRGLAGQSTWRGKLALSNVSQQTSVSTRGVITPGLNHLEIGLSAGTVVNDLIRVVGYPQSTRFPAPPLEISLETVHNNQTTTYATTGVGAWAFGKTDVRLLVNYQTTPPSADVYVNSEPVLTGVVLSDAPPSTSVAYFKGWKPAGQSFAEGENSIDNFEADVFDGNPGACQPPQ